MPRGFRGTEMSQKMSQLFFKEGGSCGTHPAWAGRVQSVSFPSEKGKAEV